MTTEFLEVEAQRDIARHLQVSFLEYYRYEPPEGEVRAWYNSLHALATQIKRSRLLDNGLILEMQLPLTSKRLDCILSGVDAHGAPNAVLVELKQWSDAAEVDEDRCVLVSYGGSNLKVQQHPSHQVKDYADYLKSFRTVFYEEPALPLHPCAWLHNFQGDPDSTLLDQQKFGEVLSEAPIFGAVDSQKFGQFLEERVGSGRGGPVLERITKSDFAPSKKLMEHTASVIRNEPVYVLLDEQRVAYERIRLAARRSVNRKNGRSVIIVEGGPGTGKSVIALNVMANLLSEGKFVQHATGSKAFTENLRKTLGRLAGTNFRYFNSFPKAEEGEIDVLLCDEAHRIRISSNFRYTRKDDRSEIPQVDELIKAAKVSVFFIDNQQAVRPYEIGSISVIRDAARKLDARVIHEKLEAQFRCAGSDDYVDWVDGLLQTRVTDVTEFDCNNQFEFRIFDSPQALEDEIRSKAAKGLSARMTAGFCWPWARRLLNGTLATDVTIGSYRRPWNARPELTGLPKTVPKASYWATDPNGIDQVGCIYTAQGFEFDFVGVIWGDDLVYRSNEGGWVGRKSFSHDDEVKRADGSHFTALVQNTYRVLLTRGLRGCYLYFTDPETRAHVESQLIR